MSGLSRNDCPGNAGIGVRIAPEYALASIGSLPHRQLRNFDGELPPVDSCSLPHRQLRKLRAITGLTE